STPSGDQISPHLPWKRNTSLWKMVFQKSPWKNTRILPHPLWSLKIRQRKPFPAFSTAFFPTAAFSKKYISFFFKRAIPTHIFKPRLERKCMHEILL
ncbi:hypothetical protein, partial [Oscillibacter sp. KLE 1728]|uniref:hypothetical protein n=1 Tax=Oscillibacter sp. KLE 1728 TaxID=1226322 RepID=UPI0025870F07